MLLKGIIQGKIDDFSYKVRIPSLHKIDGVRGATPDSQLPTATVCTLPGVVITLKRGTAVVVSFEDNDADKPTITGILFTDRTKLSESELKATGLMVSVTASLPKNTTIGEVSATSLGNLKGLTVNAQNKFDSIEQSIKNTTSHIEDAEIHVTRADKTKWNNSATAIHTHTSLMGLNQMIITSSMYGTTEPTNAEEGQLFFKLEE